MRKAAIFLFGLMVGIAMTTVFWKSRSEPSSEVNDLLTLPDGQLVSSKERIAAVPGDSGKALLALLACAGLKLKYREDLTACEARAKTLESQHNKSEASAVTKVPNNHDTPAELPKAETRVGSDRKFRPLPPVWVKTGGDKVNYTSGIDPSRSYNGTASLYLGSTGPTSSFGAFARTFDATPYLSRKVQFSAFVETSRVIGWVGLWMRVDGDQGQVLAFDNMQQRPITGTTGWRKYQITLDVPQGAQKIVLGMLVHGQGQAWCAEAELVPIPLGEGEGPTPISGTTDG